MAAPTEHLTEGQKLQADALVDLFSIDLKNTPSPTTIRFRDGPPGGTTTWGGNSFDHVPVKFSGFSRGSDAEKTRPTLTTINPEGVWNPFVKKRYFDGAVLTRYRVLRQHLEGNVLISDNQIFFVGRVPSLTAGQALTFELRTLSDGPDMILPVRVYIPPAFPFVTLR